MKIHLEEMEGSRHPVIVLDDEPDERRRNLLYDFLYDSEGNEDLVLAALDRAEAGTPVLGWGDLRVYLDMYPDGRVVIEQTERLLEENEQDNPPQIVITIGEARKLILDWIEARDKWYAEREAQRAAAGQSK
ncbi:MAG: hypothetical protein U0787_06335 [Polyangia bacterium]